MATVRNGSKSVLVVVDVQVGVMREAWEAQRIIENVRYAVEQARAKAVPVIWVQHTGDELPEASLDWQLVPELVPLPDERLILKNFNSAFEQSLLEQALDSYGATHIVLAGAATNWCIRATAYGALHHGYDLTLIKDAHSTGDMELGDGVVVQAKDIISELNVGMNWVSYPDRKSSSALAVEVEFLR